MAVELPLFGGPLCVVTRTRSATAGTKEPSKPHEQADSETISPQTTMAELLSGGGTKEPTAAELFCCLSDFSDLFDGACAAASELAAPPVSSGGKRKAAAQW